MNNLSSNRELLGDLLAEALPPGFESSVLSRTVQAARIRRRQLLALRTVALGFIALGAVLSARKPQPQLQTSVPPQQTIARYSHKTLHSVPFRGTFQTREAARAPRVLASVPVERLATDSAAIRGILRAIDDTELMTLLKGTGIALVRRNSHDAEIVGPIETLLETDIHPGAAH